MAHHPPLHESFLNVDHVYDEQETAEATESETTSHIDATKEYEDTEPPGTLIDVYV